MGWSVWALVLLGAGVWTLLAAGLVVALLRRSLAGEGQQQAQLQLQQLQQLGQSLSQLQGAWSQQAVQQQTQTEQQAQTLRSTLQDSAQGLRQELSHSLGQLQQQLLAASQASREAQDGALMRFQSSQREQFQAQTQAQDKAVAELRQSVEQRLAAIQADTEKKLEQMRLTVDEKLHATLEQRLGESFKQVAERLEQVHQGLGEMKVLARDVGSLNRVLNNVKTRGVYGEVQLGALLEQVLTPAQYAANVETVPGTGARVEFAIRLPGRGEDGPQWLPMDAKFPREDYERLLDAQERADVEGVEAAGKALELRLRLEAKTIRQKYVAHPHTTDFAILFLPTESLYAEALRRPGLVESLHREWRISLAGPTTLLATLNSLQMGFRTLALEKRSNEVWQVLGAVKTEFSKFGDVLAKTRKKLQEASNTIDAAEVRTRAMARQLRDVESLPESSTQALLERWSADVALDGEGGEPEPGGSPDNAPSKA